MRVSSIGWLYEHEDKVLQEAKRSAEITHNHPEGIKGAQAVALGVFLARNGFSKNQIKKRIEETFGYQLNRKLDMIRPEYHFDVTCQGSVPEAIIAFGGIDLEDALRNAISLGSADTQACISGALAEAYYLNISSEIKEFVISRVTADMLLVWTTFRRKYA